jgi:CRP-like cAMP-binding protein
MSPDTGSSSVDRAAPTVATGGTARPLLERDGRIALFAHDPDLLDGVAPPVAEALMARVRVPAVTIKHDEWRRLVPTSLGYVVVEGLLVRSVSLGGRESVELLGEGDVLEPWVKEIDLTLSPSVGWHAEIRTTLAELDDDFVRAVAPHPAVVSALFRRLVLRARRLAAQNALATVTPIEERVLLGLWQLADRWGRVTPRGIMLPYGLSHRLIAEMVAATRPTVSSVMSTLRGAGLVERVEGGWLLANVPDDEPEAWAAADEPEQQRLALRRWAARTRLQGAVLRDEHIRLREALAATRTRRRDGGQRGK